MKFFKLTAPFNYLLMFYLTISLVIRLALYFHPITQSSFTATEAFSIYILGFLSDVLIFILISSFLWLYLIFISNAKYHSPYGYIILGLFLAVLCYITFGNTILNEYGSALPKIAIGFLFIKMTVYSYLI
mgnify:CR=1 FL=1